MKGLLLILLLVSGLVLVAETPPVDLNKASLEELQSLPITEDQARDIWEYRTYISFFQSVYDLRKIESVDQATLDRLKPLVTVSIYSDLDETDLRREEVADLIENLGNSEGQQEGIADTWEDFLMTPPNLNRLYFSDINSFPNVSPIDATAITERIASGDSIADWRDLRGTQGVAYYGVRNLNNYVEYSDTPAKGKIYGDYQLKYNDGPRDNELDGIIVRPRNDRAPSVMNKLRLRYDNQWKFGILHNADKGEAMLLDETDKLFFHDAKFYLGFEDFIDFTGDRQPDGFLKVYAGNYRATFGEGLVMENTDYFSSRKTGTGFSKRIMGIIGDVSRSQEYALRGGALEYKRHNMSMALFISQDKKDAVLYDSNGDGWFGNDDDESTENKDRVFSYITMSERTELEQLKSEQVKLAPLRDALEETLFGGHIQYSPLIGTQIGYTIYQANYDREFFMYDNTDSLQTVLVGKASDYDKVKITDSEIAAMMSGKDYRRVMGFDWATVIQNVSISGEYAEMYDKGFGQDPHALLTSAYAQFDNLYVLALYRDYDLGFDNPYSRGFSEAAKFEDTILEKDYYLTDPALIDMYYNDARAQAEEGVYLESRYQWSRYLTMTRAYVDIWERKSDNRKAFRFQGEVEFRPIFGLRLRLKQKHQIKRDQDYLERGRSVTDESTITARMLLTQRDMIQLEYRYTQVDMPAYTNLTNDPDAIPPGGSNSNAAAQTIIHGDYIAAEYTHNFTESLKLRGAVVFWDGHGVSHWDWEDMEIDFMGSRGTKYWITLTDRISHNLYWSLKYRIKTYQAKEVDLRYYNEDIDEPLCARDVRNTEQAIRLQLDWKF